MTELPKETIITIARENRALRWLAIFLAFTTMIAIGAVLLANKKPILVWVVYEDGKISNSKGFLFDWEVDGVTQKAIDSFYLANPDREKILPYFFSAAIIERLKKFVPKDKIVRFKILKIEQKETTVTVNGIVQRPDTADENLLLTLSPTERTHTNPFGLIVTNATTPKLTEEVKEKEEKGLTLDATEQTHGKL